MGEGGRQRGGGEGWRESTEREREMRGCLQSGNLQEKPLRVKGRTFQAG